MIIHSSSTSIIFKYTEQDYYN